MQNPAELAISFFSKVVFRMGSSHSTKMGWNADNDFEIFIQAIQEVNNLQRLYYVKKATEKFLKTHKVSVEKLNVYNGILAIMEKQYVQ